MQPSGISKLTNCGLIARSYGYINDIPAFTTHLLEALVIGDKSVCAVLNEKEFHGYLV